jgi:hypothetical protein
MSLAHFCSPVLRISPEQKTATPKAFVLMALRLTVG